MNMNFDQARFNMVEQQIRPWAVLDSRVLSLLETIHREDFVPVRYRKLAFADLAVPLACGQFMMRPKIEARMLQALNLREKMNLYWRLVREVGLSPLAWLHLRNAWSVLNCLRSFTRRPLWSFRTKALPAQSCSLET